MYVTEENISAKLGRDLTESEREYFNDVLQDAIEATINYETETRFESGDDETIYVDGSCSKYLVTPIMSSITSVMKDDVVVNSDNYVPYPRTGSIQAIRNLNGTWSEGNENYAVTGKIGYGEVPGDIRAVAVEMAINSLNQSNSDYKSERVGDWSVTYKDSLDELSATSLNTLKRYKRLVTRI